MSSLDILIYFTLFEGTGFNCCVDNTPAISAVTLANPAACNVAAVILIVLPPLYFFCTPVNKSSSLRVSVSAVEPAPKVPALNIIVSPISYKLPVAVASIVETV